MSSLTESSVECLAEPCVVVSVAIPAQLHKELFPDTIKTLTLDQIGFIWNFWCEYGERFEGFVSDSEYLMVSIVDASSNPDCTVYMCGLTRDYRIVEKEISTYDARVYPILHEIPRRN